MKQQLQQLVKWLLDNRRTVLGFLFFISVFILYTHLVYPMMEPCPQCPCKNISGVVYYINPDYILLQTNTTTTTLITPQQYICPDCPECEPCQQATSTTPSTTTASGTTLPDVIVSGGEYYTTKPTKIDFKYQMCNPFENVSVPLEYIVQESEQTYNFTYLNGTTELRHRANETKYKVIKGGCIIVSANCCRCKDGGTATPINAKYYKQYYEEILSGCRGKPVVCPMIMKSPVGCRPTATCLEGRCQIVNR